MTTKPNPQKLYERETCEGCIHFVVPGQVCQRAVKAGFGSQAHTKKSERCDHLQPNLQLRQVLALEALSDLASCLRCTEGGGVAFETC
jgi:hypothetical protein